MSDEIDLGAVRAASRREIAEQRAVFSEPPLTAEQQVEITQEYQRATHFDQYAKMLWTEITGEISKGISEPEKLAGIIVRLISKRAYDHTRDVLKQYLRGWNRSDLDRLDEIMSEIKDMTEWPKDETLEAITRDVQRVMVDRPATEVVTDLLARYNMGAIEQSALPVESTPVSEEPTDIETVLEKRDWDNLYWEHTGKYEPPLGEKQDE